jgi:hypothetical protein
MTGTGLRSCARSQGGRHETAELAFKKLGEGNRRPILEIRSDDLYPNG